MQTLQKLGMIGLLTMSLTSCGDIPIETHTYNIHDAKLDVKTATPAEADVSGNLALEFDAEVDAKRYNAKGKNIFVIADFKNTSAYPALVNVMNQSQAKANLNNTGVKYYKIDIHSKNASAKEFIAKNSKRTNGAPRMMPIMVALDGSTNAFKILEGTYGLSDYTLDAFAALKVQAPKDTVVQAASAIMFSKQGCGYCSDMKPVVEKLQTEGYAIKIVMKENDSASVKNYGIGLFPSFVFLDKAGKELKRIEGMTSADTIKKNLIK